MLHPDKIFGRLGNQMFQGAFLLSTAKKLGIDHYFQDLKWIDDSTLDLYRVGIIPNEYVAIHVRRGDYVGHPLYVDLTFTEYYEKAVDEFPDAKFCIYSDDIEWCKEYFGDEFQYNTDDELTAFNKMAGSKGVIMANSSFSWWAGYLCKGKVIAPSQWFTDGTRITYPESWQVI